MTKIIHLNSDFTDDTIHKIRLTAETFYDRADRIYAAFSLVEWEGAAKDAFLHDLYRCTSSLKSLSDFLDLLGFQLSQETEQWVQTAFRLSD